MTLKLEFTTEPRRTLRLVTFESRASHRKRSSRKGLRLGRKNFEDVSSMMRVNGLARRSRNQELLAGGLARRLSLPTRYLWVTKQTLQPVVSQGLRLRASQHR